MRVLALESTCDETGASVVEDGRRVLSNVVATQVDLHAKYRGVVPEIASRAHIENLLPVLRESLAQAACTFADLDAVAVAHRPGLIGSLLIGVTAAKTLAWSLNKPLIGVDHVHAHLYSVMLQKGSGLRVQGSVENADNPPPSPKAVDGALSLSAQPAVGEGRGEGRTTATSNSSSLNPEPRTLNPSFPALGLVCSGGHTALYLLKSWLDVSLIGTTIDDAVGEAYDKVSALLGLGYPGGPIIDRLAAQGDPKSIAFPRSLLGHDSLDFSFSGLKTAVLYNVHGVPTKDHRPPTTPPQLAPERLADIAASFQAACVDVIVKKLKRALKKTGAKSVIVGGGVSANRGLRAALARFPVPTHFPALEYCTDNAAMSAGLAHLHLEADHTSPLDLDAITHSQFAPT